MLSNRKSIYYYIIFCTSIILFIHITKIGSHDLTEYGFMELAQIFVLSSSIIIFLFYMHLLKKRPDHSNNYPLFLQYMPSLLFLTIGREISWGRAFGYDRQDSVSVKYLFIAIFLSSIFYISYKNWTKRRQILASVKNFKLLMFYAVAGVIWVLIGNMFEKGAFNIEANVYMEEFCELMGYFTFLYIAIIASLDKSLFHNTCHSK